MSGFFDDASWVLIPEGIKEDVVYAQKPTNGLGDLTFTRASDATRTNSAGVIERTPWNLVQDSEMFSTASWTKQEVTISPNVAIAPNGTLTADKATPSTLSTTHQITSGGLVISQTCAFGIYAKADGYNTIEILDRATASNGAIFNLSNGTFTIRGTATATITDAGNGWYRCTVVAVTTGVRYYIPNTSSTFAGNGTSGVLIWGAQLVEGTDAKPYFATTNRQDVPRLHYRNADGTLSTCPRLLLEPQRTNSIRNSTMVGAVAGSPGTLPTNWGITAGGLTQTIVGIGTESGIQYVDVRLNGTATGTFVRYDFEGSTNIAASNGQAWSESVWIKSTSGTVPQLALRFNERTSLGALVKTADQNITISSTLQRFTFSRTLDGGATVAVVQPSLLATISIGVAYDFTIRIAAPQMELGAYASTFIPTTTAAVTRLVDNFSRNNLFTNNIVTSSGGTWFVDLSSNLSYTRDASAVGVFLSSSSTGAGAGSYTFGISTINTTARLAIAKRENGVFSALYTTLVDNVKIAIKWNGTTADVFVNGVKVVTATSFTSAALEFLNTSNLDVPKFINQMALFPRALTDAQCIQLTT